MAFVKRDVKDRVVQYPRRYQMVEVQPGIFDLIPMPGTITEPGTPINKAYLQPIEEAIEDIEDGTTVVQNAYSANNAVTAERATKLATARKINGANFDGTVDITVADNTKAPTNHASTGSSYGLGTTANYGHVKTRNDLVGTETSGVALTPAMGKALKDLIDGETFKYYGSFNGTTNFNITLPSNWKELIIYISAPMANIGIGFDGTQMVTAYLNKANSSIIANCMVISGTTVGMAIHGMDPHSYVGSVSNRSILNIFIGVTATVRILYR